MKKYKAVLFDLDGTINDSGPGIMNSCRYAMEKMGHEPLPEETMRRFVGPSLQYSFQTFCGISLHSAAIKELISNLTIIFFNTI